MAPEKEDFDLLAQDLIGKWSKLESWVGRSKGGGEQITADRLAKGLQTLAGDEEIVKKLFTKTGLTPKAMTVAEKLIGEFQKNYSSGKVDGIFGIVTLNAMKAVKACGHARKSRIKPLDENSMAGILNASQAKNVIYYHVDKESFNRSPIAPKVDDLVTTAFGLWLKHADIGLHREGVTEEDANVVINMRPLGDGIGGMLGLAHIGGPGINQKLECSLDSAEDWNEQKFQVALCHELGHILGLTHSKQSGQLMSPFLSDVTEPRDEDVTRIQAMWGKAKEAAVGPVLPDEEDRDEILGLF